MAAENTTVTMYRRGLENTKQSFNIVVLGGGGVGKSSITFRLVYNDFLTKYDPTLEDSYRKDNFQVDGEICPIEILDTAGQVMSNKTTIMSA